MRLYRIVKHHKGKVTFIHVGTDRIEALTEYFAKLPESQRTPERNQESNVRHEFESASLEGIEHPSQLKWERVPEPTTEPVPDTESASQELADMVC